jgi:hypothetical protein
VTTGKKPRCRNCAAASKPSPPLLPGPHATQIVRACGAMAMASRATARPARCINVWAGRAAAAACSMRRVAAMSNRSAAVADVMRCIDPLCRRASYHRTMMLKTLGWLLVLLLAWFAGFVGLGMALIGGLVWALGLLAAGVGAVPAGVTLRRVPLRDIAWAVNVGCGFGVMRWLDVPAEAGSSACALAGDGRRPAVPRVLRPGCACAAGMDRRQMDAGARTRIAGRAAGQPGAPAPLGARSTPRPSMSMSAVLPPIRSPAPARCRTDSAQPLEPWPRLSHTPGMPLAPSTGGPSGSMGRAPFHSCTLAPVLAAGRAGKPVVQHLVEGLERGGALGVQRAADFGAAGHAHAVAQARDRDLVALVHQRAARRVQRLADRRADRVAVHRRQRDLQAQRAQQRAEARPAHTTTGRSCAARRFSPATAQVAGCAAPAARPWC